MKKIFFGLLMLTSLYTVAQRYNISWGDALKLKKGTADLNIVAADKSGYYFIEQRLKASFGFGGSGASYKLMKFDNSFEPEWDEDYNKELKGLDFVSIQPLNDDLYLFASDFIRKEKLYKVYGVKIDKSSGKLDGDFAELGSYTRESRKEDFDVKLSKMKGDKNFLLVSDLTGAEHTRIAVSLLDKGLKPISSTNIDLSYDAGFYSLQDVKLVQDKIVLLGKSFEEIPWKRKKKRKVFKSFTLDIYDTKGVKLKTIPLNIDDNFTLEGKLLELENNEVALAGFYSKDGKKKTLNGFFINKINVSTGELALKSSKEISAGMLGQNYSEDTNDNDDDDDDSKDKKEKKEAKKGDDDDSDEEFDNEFTIKSVDVNPLDGTFMITAEISDIRSYTYQTYSPGSGNLPGHWTTTYVYEFTNKDMLLICADTKGAIKWMNVIPKKQYERISTSRNYGSGINFYSTRIGYFAKAGGMPYYSSFKSTFVRDKYVLVYNDNKKNEDVGAYGDKVKSIYNFKKRGEMFGVNIDVATGKMKKVPISACSDDDVITMPRHSFLIGNSLIVPAWRQRSLGKTIFKIAKITIQ